MTGEFSTGIRQAERAERVLLVDDNPDNLQVLYQTLEGRDYRLLIAKSGEDALGIAHRARPALILLDIMMPGMDGYEVCRRLKVEPATSDTPIIFLSALGDTASKLKGFELGAVDYITKPFQAEEVIVRVGTHLKIHRLEQRLSERNRILEVENQRILAAMGEGLYGLDCRGCITFANPAAARLTGWEESTLLGRDFHALHLHARADGQAYPPDQGPVHTTLGRGEVLHRDRDVFWRRDGSSFPVEYTCAPLREAGGVSGAVLVFKDISERRRAERRLQRIHEALVRSHRDLGEAQQRLIQAAKLESVGRLAAGVAHEVKNPLAIIQLGLDYLSRAAPVPEPGGEVLKDMGDAVRRADTVVKGLLAFSRAEPAEMQIQDLNRVIHASLDLVRHELVQHDIDLDLDLAAQPAEVALDRGKMQQVFINLFMNAIQAMGRGGVLSVRSVPGRMDDTQASGSHTPDWFHAGDPIVVAEVADTGCGISENKVNKIFDPFFTTKPTGQGTGLGLSVTQTIARQHKAILTIQNRKRQRGVVATLTFKAIDGK